MILTPPVLTLGIALEFIEEDELVELAAIRVPKSS